jgi:cytochrome c oxidase subunit 3
MPTTVLPEPPVIVERPPAHERQRSGAPPTGRDDGGGDEGGGGGGEPERDDLPFRPGKLALAFVLFSLSVLFVVTLAATLMLRKGAATWPPAGAPPFPRILWLNTGLLLASSAVLRAGVRAIGRGATAALTASLAVTTTLGVAFLLGQLEAWRTVLEVGETMASGSHGVIFYWLTGLHGAHVVGGIVLLIVCLARAARGRYSASSHLGVELCELYWHFLGVVWIVLVTALFLVL